jgi:hypothetical protein
MGYGWIMKNKAINRNTIVFFANKIISIFSSVRFDNNEVPITVGENCFTDCQEKNQPN